MRIETYIPGLSKNTIEIVKHAESLGYDALVSGELNNEPFLPVLLGLEHSKEMIVRTGLAIACLLYTSPSPRDATLSRMPSSA